MKPSSLPLALGLFSLQFGQLAQASFFGRGLQHQDHQPNALTTRESSYCGPHHMPCPTTEPCCNNGTCHTTSMEACPISLGCDPRHSHLNGCFALPACHNLKDQFKHSNLLIPRQVFTGDPNQAHWISDFDHIAPYAKIDQHEHKLLLRTRRDMVKTQSGGGFGATASSTRWNQYGSFSAKIKSGSTGPGIVTAFLLSNPALGEEISFELTGKDPKKVITNYYRRVPAAGDENHNHNNGGHDQKSGHHHNGAYDAISHAHSHSHLEAHEEIHDLKYDSTEREMVYKIEWNSKMIRWSVDGKVLRTVAASSSPHGGLPENAMQLQLIIWDAGYSPETMAWAGGKTSYGPDNLQEYVARVSSVEIACQNPKEGNKPWPGPEASKRLKAAQAKAAKDAKRSKKMNKVASAKNFFEIAILSLIKWAFVLLAIVCGAAYFTEPKGRSIKSSTASTSAPALSSSSSLRKKNL